MGVNDYDPNALRYGEDATYDALGDDYDNDPTQVTPSLGVAQQGARPKRQLAAQYRNWFDNNVAWMLRAIEEPLDDIADLKGVDVTKTPPVVAVKHWGFYFYDPDSTASDDFPRIVEPTTGPGAWYLFNCKVLAAQALNADTSGTVPDGVDLMFLAHWGAGGGGGGGGQPANGDANSYGVGGAGGGSGKLVTTVLPATPGASWSWTMGTAGGGGAVETAGTAGGDSIFAQGATELSRARGAGGGRAGGPASTTDPPCTSLGGRPPGGIFAWPSFSGVTEISDTDPFRVDANEGGPGGGRLTAGAGAGGPGGRQALHNHDFNTGVSGNHAGGAGGATGADAGGFLGGNGGGGGAAGVTGAGAAGGAGGAGHATTGVNGSNGGAVPVANSGAGGGGGGGGGNAATTAGTPGQGTAAAAGGGVLIFLAHEVG